MSKGSLYLSTGPKNYAKSMNDVGLIRSPEIDIDNYTFHGYINEGSYCKVRVIQSKSTKQKFALKYMPISQSPTCLKSMAQERDVLARLRYPFLCNLNIAFQDHGFMFMLLDLMPGGDLRYYLHNYTLSDKAIKILIGEVALAIDYVHSKSLVHRDVKPENILLDAQGHAHLCDFNIAASLSYESPLLRRATGTFNYMAPEMHRGLAYGEQVDWWALGVVFYECVYGQLPFRGTSREDMVSQMCRGPQYRNCEFNIGRDCIEAIQKFLKFQPSERTRDCYDIFKLAFFNGYTRDVLEQAFELEECGAFRIPPNHIFDTSMKCDRTNILSHEYRNWPTKRTRGKVRKNYEIPSHSNKIRNKIKKCGEKFIDRVNMSVSKASFDEVTSAGGTSNDSVFKTYIHQNATCIEDREDKVNIRVLTQSTPTLTMSSSSTLLTEPSSPLSPDYDRGFTTEKKENNRWVKRPFKIKNLLGGTTEVKIMSIYNEKVDV